MRFGLVCLVLSACAASPTEPVDLHHEFPRVQVAPGEETDQVCQSWTLDNAEALYVNAVTMQNGGGFHHSNWFYVPEDLYAGPDGTWPCAERNYDQSTAAIVGGVAFAQSTQATEETLAFTEGAAYRIPPHSRIAGQLHLFNATDAPLDTGIAFDIHPIREDDTKIRLQPAVFVYQTLAIPPMARSRFQTDCDVAKSFGAPLDFNFYYMLPHYHALGTAMNLVTDAGTGPVSVFGGGGHIGDVKSQKLEPPFSAAGTSHYELSCDYTNSTANTVTWGNATQEMCILVSFTDSPYIIFSGVFSDNNYVTTTDDGVMVYEGTCGTSFVEPTHD